jgi:hypothetical protein
LLFRHHLRLPVLRLELQMALQQVLRPVLALDQQQ